MFGTIALTLFLIAFSMLALYQIVSIFVHAIDLSQSYSPAAIAVFTVFLVVALSALASWAMNGENISQTAQETVQNTINQTTVAIEENIPTINVGGING